jgi:hypothetical protein
MLKLIFVWIALFLPACNEVPATKHDIIGRFCGQTSVDGGRARSHVLNLASNGRYNYSVFLNDRPSPILYRNGGYAIYGSDPVDRVELKGICFSNTCGDYPAQIIKYENSINIIIEDGQGDPLTLEMCSS